MIFRFLELPVSPATLVAELYQQLQYGLITFSEFLEFCLAVGICTVA